MTDTADDTDEIAAIIDDRRRALGHLELCVDELEFANCPDIVKQVKAARRDLEAITPAPTHRARRKLTRGNLVRNSAGPEDAFAFGQRLRASVGGY